jgi:cell division protein FtsA
MVLEKFRKARKKAADNDYIVALDIGTEFVKALIAKLNDDELEIVGVGRSRQDVSDMHSGAIADIAG